MLNNNSDYSFPYNSNRHFIGIPLSTHSPSLLRVFHRYTTSPFLHKYTRLSIPQLPPPPFTCHSSTT